jgi:hypothetical protein
MRCDTNSGFPYTRNRDNETESFTSADIPACEWETKHEMVIAFQSKSRRSLRLVPAIRRLFRGGLTKATSFQPG